MRQAKARRWHCHWRVFGRGGRFSLEFRIISTSLVLLLDPIRLVIYQNMIMLINPITLCFITYVISKLADNKQLVIKPITHCFITHVDSKLGVWKFSINLLARLINIKSSYFLLDLCPIARFCIFSLIIYFSSFSLLVLSYFFQSLFNLDTIPSLIVCIYFLGICFRLYLVYLFVCILI